MDSPVSPKPLDTSVRRKGTILDLLSIDLPGLLAKRDLKKDTNSVIGIFPACVYTYFLDKSEFGIFDIAKVEIYGTEKEYDSSDYVALHLSSSRQIPLSKTIGVINTLVEMYGSDWMGREQLESFEMDQLEGGGFWFGRKWPMSDIHALTDMVNYIYSVNLKFHEEGGFGLTIMGYNHLEEYFGMS